MRLVPIGGRTVDHRRTGRPVRALASMTALVAGLLTVAGCTASSSSTATPRHLQRRQQRRQGGGDAGRRRRTALHRVPARALPPGRPAGPHHQLRLGPVRAGRPASTARWTSRSATTPTCSTRRRNRRPRGPSNGLNLVIVADGYDAVANTMEVLALPGPAGSVRNTLEGSEGMSVQDASLLTIGQYPTTVSVNDLQRVIQPDVPLQRDPRPALREGHDLPLRACPPARDRGR